MPPSASRRSRGSGNPPHGLALRRPVTRARFHERLIGRISTRAEERHPSPAAEASRPARRYHRPMPTPAAFAATAALLGDPARAAMLQALLSGEALTAGELARVAGIGAPAASAHLSRLVEGGLLSVHRQGRHRYHRLASAEVARVLESLMQLAAQAQPAPRIATGPRRGGEG